MKNILLLDKTGFIGQNMLDFFENKYNLLYPNHQELDVLDEVEVAQYLKSG